MPSAQHAVHLVWRHARPWIDFKGSAQVGAPVRISSDGAWLRLASPVCLHALNCLDETGL